MRSRCKYDPNGTQNTQWEPPNCPKSDMRALILKSMDDHGWNTPVVALLHHNLTSQYSCFKQFRGGIMLHIACKMMQHLAIRTGETANMGYLKVRLRFPLQVCFSDHHKWSFHVCTALSSFVHCLVQPCRLPLLSQHFRFWAEVGWKNNFVLHAGPKSACIAHHFASFCNIFLPEGIMSLPRFMFSCFASDVWSAIQSKASK